MRHHCWAGGGRICWYECLASLEARRDRCSGRDPRTAATQPREATTPPVVYSAVVDSIIHPVSAEYMIQTMDRADRADAALIVFTLRTPGGLVDSTRAIVTHMLAAKTPVASLSDPSELRRTPRSFCTLSRPLACCKPRKLVRIGLKK